MAQYAVEKCTCADCITHFLHKVYYQSAAPPPPRFILWVELCLEVNTAGVVRTGGQESGNPGNPGNPLVKVNPGSTGEVTSKCGCAPFQGVGFCEVTSDTLYLTQCCVLPRYRGRGLARLIAAHFISSYPTRRVVFWSVGPTLLTPTVITSRFAVSLSVGAGDAPKTAGMFFSAGTNTTISETTTETIRTRRREIPSQLSDEDNEIVTSSVRCDDVITSLEDPVDSYIVSRASRDDSVRLHQFIANFQTQRKHNVAIKAKKLSFSNFNLLLNPKYKDISRVIVIKKKDAGIGTAANSDVVGVLSLRFLAIRTAAAVRTTALLSNIAWDTTLPSLPQVLLDTMVTVSRDNKCDALVVNECCGLGEVLERDGRFVDMRVVGVQNRVFVREGGVVLVGGSGDHCGMTLF